PGTSLGDWPPSAANPRLLEGRPAASRGHSGSAMEAGRCGVGFGPHLVYHGYHCPQSRLDDLDRLYQLLDTLPEQIHMTKIMPPYVLRHDTKGGAEKGFSGFVLIAQSHISIHTFPARGWVSVDVFSCEPFDVEDAIAALQRVFRPRRIEWQ